VIINTSLASSRSRRKFCHWTSTN